MRIAVIHASRYGATTGVAERIARRLSAKGHDAVSLPAEPVPELGGFDAFVIGSAAYFGRWLKPASALVRDRAAELASRPVWLFSSGPLGASATDERGSDLKTEAVPAEIEEHRAALRARDHHVFFGALDPAKLGLRDRLIRALPAGRKLLPAGDFRDWAEIDAWAERIAGELGAGRGASEVPLRGGHEEQPPA